MKFQNRQKEPVVLNFIVVVVCGDSDRNMAQGNILE